jgi:hypothetical protein
VLTESPVVRAVGPRVLFLMGAVITAAILLWTHHLRLSGDPHGLTTIFFYLFVDQDYRAAVCELLILGAAVFVAALIPTDKLLQAAGKHPGTIAVAFAVALSAGALLVYHDHPLSMDEYTAYFQSQVFAAGHLAGRFPLPIMDWVIPPGFQNYFLNVSSQTGEVASNYWPGHALLMAPFMLAGIPWVCNPVLSALTLLVIHRLALYLFEDVQAAGMAVLLTIASPVMFGLGISYYSMPAHLLCNCLYALLLVRPSAWRALAAGLVGSIALCLHNPLPHTLFALPWMIWIITRPGGLRLFAALCAGYLPLSLLLGVGWYEFTNDLRHSVAVPGAHLDILARIEALLQIFSMPNANVLLARFIALAKTWVWAVPGMMLLAIYGAVRWRRHPLCMLLAVSALTTLVGYVFFPQDQGHGWGNRYFHSAWMALPLLATAALFHPRLSRDTAIADSAEPQLFGDTASRSYVTACVLLTLVFGIGLQAWQMQRFMAADLNQLPHDASTGPQVVILDVNPNYGFYVGDLVQNDPFLRGPVIRMMSQGRAEDRQMMAQFYPNMQLMSANHFGWVWSEKGAAHDASKR